MARLEERRYFDLNTHFRGLFGCRVHKITVDAGLNCPNRDGTISTGGCIYCNCRGAGTGAFAKGLSITEQLERGKKAVAKRFKAKKFIAYFQSFTNTHAPVEKLRELYDEAFRVDGIAGMAVGTRPDCVSEPVLDLIGSYASTHHVWIEYGLQSARDKTLAIINRGHDFQIFQNAVEMTKNRGIKICAHIILGLPGETRRHMLETAKRIAALCLDGVKIHLLYVTKDTELENMYRRGEYVCLEQREYAELVCDFLELLPPGMVIQRLTGDPHPRELVAPEWALEKKENVDLINRILVARDSRQGEKFKSG